MFTQAQVKRHTAYIRVDVTKRIQYVNAVKACVRVKSVVVQALITRVIVRFVAMEHTLFVQGVIVKPLNAREEAVIVFLQLEVMNTFDDG